MHKFFIIVFLLFTYFSIYPKELSSGYKDVKLGMTMSEVSVILKKSNEFRQKDEEILSIRIDPDKEILTYEGLGYIKIGYFHFHKDKLFQIFLRVEDKKIGYYLLLKNNTEKFGKPSKLTPNSAIWKDADTQIIIEKPCVIKYIYLPIWNELIAKDQSPDDKVLKSRQDFVNDL